MRSCIYTVCESARVAKILWRSLSEDDQLVSKKVVEGILRMERLVECAYAGGIQLHDDDKEEIKKVCYTIVGAMYEMEGQLSYRPSWWSFNFKEEIKTVDCSSQSRSQQLISILVKKDEVIMKTVSEISNININIVEGGDVDVLGRVKEVMLLPRVSRERVVVCIVGESESSSSSALAREVYNDNWFKADMNHGDFAGVSMRHVRMLWALMQHLCPPLGHNHTNTICPLPLPLPADGNVVNPWFEMSMIQRLLKEFQYMLVIDGVNNEAEWEWVDTTARSNWLLITTCSKQVARIIASRYPIVYNILPENNIHFPPNTADSKKDVASAPSTHFLRKMFSIIGKAIGFLKKMFSIIGKCKGKGGMTPLNTITKSFITDIGMRGYYVIEHKRCPICLDNPNDIAFGCGHLTCCDCGKRLELCPICRSGIETKLKIYD